MSSESTSQVTPNGVSKRRRQRTTQACDTCRKRKIKCDNQLPRCSHCLAQDLECLYTERQKKRGPPKGYIDSIETRLAKMETLLLTMTELDDDEAAEAPGSATKSNYSHSPSQTSELSDAPRAAPSGPPRPVVEDTLSTVNASLTEPNDAQSTDPSSGPADQSHRLYTGTNAIAWLNRTSLLGTKTGDKLRQTVIRDGSVVSSGIPNPALIKQLLKLYFQHIHPVFPILHKRSFFKRLQASTLSWLYANHTSFAILSASNAKASILTSLGSDPTYGELRALSPLLLNAMYYAAVWHLGTNDQPNLTQWRETLAVIFYERAKNFLDDVFVMPSISTIQALLLLSKHAMPNGSNWMFTGMAVRMAIDLGLNRNHTTLGGQALSPLDLEERRRCWWACLLADAQISLFLGRPLTIDSVDYDTHLPEMVADQWNEFGIPSGNEEPNAPPTPQLAANATASPSMATPHLDTGATSPQFAEAKTPIVTPHTSIFYHLTTLGRIATRVNREVYPVRSESSNSSSSVPTDKDFDSLLNRTIDQLFHQEVQDMVNTDRSREHLASTSLSNAGIMTYSQPTGSWETLVNIDSDLRTWYSQLPTYLQYSPEEYFNQRPPPCISVAFIHIFFHLVRILLHRPYIRFDYQPVCSGDDGDSTAGESDSTPTDAGSTAAPASSSQRAQKHDPQDTPKPIIDKRQQRVASQYVCFASATSIVNIIENLCRSFPGRHSSMALPCALLTAGLIHISNSLSTEKNHAQLGRLYTKRCLDLVECMAESTAVVARIRLLISDLALFHRISLDVTAEGILHLDKLDCFTECILANFPIVNLKKAFVAQFLSRSKTKAKSRHRRRHSMAPSESNSDAETSDTKPPPAKRRRSFHAPHSTASGTATDAPLQNHHHASPRTQPATADQSPQSTGKSDSGSQSRLPSPLLDMDDWGDLDFPKDDGSLLVAAPSTLDFDAWDSYLLGMMGQGAHDTKATGVSPEKPVSPPHHDTATTQAPNMPPNGSSASPASWASKPEEPTQPLTDQSSTNSVPVPNRAAYSMYPNDMATLRRQQQLMGLLSMHPIPQPPPTATTTTFTSPTGSGAQAPLTQPQSAMKPPPALGGYSSNTMTSQMDPTNLASGTIPVVHTALGLLDIFSAKALGFNINLAAAGVPMPLSGAHTVPSHHTAPSLQPTTMLPPNSGQMTNGQARTEMGSSDSVAAPQQHPSGATSFGLLTSSPNQLTGPPRPPPASTSSAGEQVRSHWPPNAPGNVPGGPSTLPIASGTSALSPVAALSAPNTAALAAAGMFDNHMGMSSLPAMNNLNHIQLQHYLALQNRYRDQR
ncbi:hypothetical protein H4R34_001372 [Dimargaris verticillata]|uniref:Zn(2)-C6 fungal-type domain-containing protein n=1 Tax=Dimargaris verticillata TaxID=2761393 RepID=A0A9W8EDV2_9FUNG|nr:hypothetical protein H4R34_001372 [Dimargaris verticillata]